MVIKPDPRTEFLLDVSQHEGQWEAHLQCARGDSRVYAAHWQELTDLLGQQNVRLLPLRDLVTGSGPASTGDSAGFGQPRGESDSERGRWLDEAADEAHRTRAAGPAAARRAGQTHTHTHTHQGWERWA